MHQTRRADNTYLKTTGLRRALWGSTALFAALAAGTLLRDRPLLERAARVSGYRGGAYAWLSDRALIAGRDGVGFVQFDPHTGTSTPLEELNRKLDVRKHKVILFQLSPDGRWLLVKGDMRWYRHGSSLYLASSLVAATLDGSRRVDLRPEGDEFSEEVAWCPDSRQWVDLSYGDSDYGLTRSTLDTPGRETGYGWCLSTLLGCSTPRLVGVRRDNRVILVDDDHYSTQPSTHASILELIPGYISLPEHICRSQQVHSLAVRLPDGARVREVVLSPRGDRLAWLFACSRLPLIQQTFVRWFPRLVRHCRPDNGVGLWVSRVDGTDLHQIGYQDLPHGRPGLAEPRCIQWTRDGRRLSFLYKDALYAVLAD